MLFMPFLPLLLPDGPGTGRLSSLSMPSRILRSVAVSPDACTEPARSLPLLLGPASFRKKGVLLRSEARAMKALFGFESEIRLPAPFAALPLPLAGGELPADRNAGEERIRGCRSCGACSSVGLIVRWWMSSEFGASQRWGKPDTQNPVGASRKPHLVSLHRSLSRCCCGAESQPTKSRSIFVDLAAGPSCCEVSGCSASLYSAISLSESESCSCSRCHNALRSD